MRANLVFTSGQSLFEAKRDWHPADYAFPSGIDGSHFARARSLEQEPEDQAPIAHPRLGYCGVIGEHIDMELLDGLAAAQPNWHIVLDSPVVGINESNIPRRQNVHCLGGKSYDKLPDYLGGWDVALMSFAINEATRFISPTKMLEYLAAGLPVVSTPLCDVMFPYGEETPVHIASTPDEFVRAVEGSLFGDRAVHNERGDVFLSHNSWERTWDHMDKLIKEVVTGRTHSNSDVPQLGGHDRNRFIKVSGIGRERLGIICQIARDIRRNGGNICLQCSMQVAGEFAVIFIAAFDRDNLSGQQNVLRGFGQNALGDEFVVFAREVKISSFARRSRAGQSIS